ncbi:hypothetical protein [Rufibacter sp. LB8]|uniref:hypothetical protein n=1 Tax=Rufibacter sp. LB8 TaxID=2777781 RepID=UPI00178C29DF|nr:hypothetical protein [Rufibacter sp. LB8]
MKKLLLVAALGMFGFASCKSTSCPAYAQKTDRAADQKVMVKATSDAKATRSING